MPQKISFSAQSRPILGKKVQQYRNSSLIPANVSGNLEHSVPVLFERTKFSALYKQVGDTGLFYLKVEGESGDRPVLISEVQYHPVTNQILHVVLRQVDLKEKISAEVPVELIGEFDIKNALVVTLHDSIEVEALPQDFPEKFEIDISKFTEIGQMVAFKDLSFDKSKVSLTIEEGQLDEPVVMVQEVKEEVEVVEVVLPTDAAAGETPAAGDVVVGEGPAVAEEKVA